MSGQTSGSLIILIILGLVSWYYYNKFQESEQNYRKLYYQLEKEHIKNKNMQIRIHDLESYRNDISKTFNVLDKELVAINSHLQRRNNNDVNLNKTASANVSILTPELLNSLLSESEVNIKGEINSVSNDNKDEVDTIIDDNKVEEDINSEVGDNVINEMELGLQENYGNLEKEGFHSDIELEHLNFKLGDNYNKFLIN
jgi:hypothetical protein